MHKVEPERRRKSTLKSASPRKKPVSAMDYISKVLHHTSFCIDSLTSAADEHAEPSGYKLRVEEVLHEGLVGQVLPEMSTWLDALLQDPKTQSQSVRLLLASDVSLLGLTSAMRSVMDVCVWSAAMKREAQRYAWSSVEAQTCERESDHVYAQDARVRNTVHIPGASCLTISFDPRSSTTLHRDSLRFLGHDDAHAEWSYGEEEYSGVGRWPGVKGVPNLVIPADKFVYTFKAER